VGNIWVKIRGLFDGVWCWCLWVVGGGLLVGGGSEIKWIKEIHLCKKRKRSSDGKLDFGIEMCYTVSMKDMREDSTRASLSMRIDWYIKSEAKVGSKSASG
jgi:hypothetical protein